MLSRISRAFNKVNLLYQTRRALMVDNTPTIFDKIINKEIPSTVVYEDEQVLAFRDVSPQAPTHILIIPKKKDGLTGISKAESRHEPILGHLLYVTSLIAKQENLDQGYRIVINEGKHGGQAVHHLHVHLLGGSQCLWPPGTQPQKENGNYAKLLYLFVSIWQLQTRFSSHKAYVCMNRQRVM
eukprot:TRINITY_DN1784_c0_g1_i11.p1 TRINITY_DN1784_c0_g1~~TRINITY_DN1784_c0_g1_i11.p1  ORF type:complete len:183 (+),score=4.20 TRINITY_DN1784_c0_g1_i11:249-797(+)